MYLSTVPQVPSYPYGSLLGSLNTSLLPGPATWQPRTYRLSLSLGTSQILTSWHDPRILVKLYGNLFLVLNNKLYKILVLYLFSREIQILNI